MENNSWTITRKQNMHAAFMYFKNIDRNFKYQNSTYNVKIVKYIHMKLILNKHLE
jgi:hypothetical protein